MPAFKLVRTEQVFQGRTFKLRRDTVQLPNGKDTTLDIVDHVGSVVMVPVDSEGNIVFVRQYRQPTGLELLELPAGTRDGDEPPEMCAAREMREETGLAAGNLENLGAFYLAPGYSTEYMYAFLATELTPNPLPADADEFLRVERMSVREAMTLAEKGELKDAKSLAALLLARNSLHKYLMD
jgi:8-oxo-dGTP pyrophosphatase MutT (NUDIX family)